ncbi:pectate lyase [Streptomyces sp. NPDC127098]|uniref:pectate lyase n=1 Tax=Streptomyces sp. NPDC127098 TaxID=3347137 RepID=UPI003664EEA0
MRSPHRHIGTRGVRSLLSIGLAALLATTGLTTLAGGAGAEEPAASAPAVERPLAADFPTPTDEIVVHETILVDEPFDGENVRYVPGPELGAGDQNEDQLPVFRVEDGGSLSNVIIGSPGVDGVHCYDSCTLTNVWWENIGEDAATFRGGDGSRFTVSGGAAVAGDDKVFQHNGGGTLTVRNFVAEDFATLVRSCGNCSTQYQRDIVLDGVEVTVPADRLVGINENYGDTATLRNVTIVGDSGRDVVPCQKYIGNDDGDEPDESGADADGTYCRYAASDITYR